MSRNNSIGSNVSLKKWLPPDGDDWATCFKECKDLKKFAQSFSARIRRFLKDYQLENAVVVRKNTVDSESLLGQLNDILIDLENISSRYTKLFKLLTRKSIALLSTRSKMWRESLFLEKLIIVYFLQELISQIAHLYIYYGDKILTVTFKISIAFNALLSLNQKYHLLDTMVISSNTCPYLYHIPRKISITKLLQILALNRAELCAHKLIDCLLETYKSFESDYDDDDDSSDSSSMEIYKALTNHMSTDEIKKMNKSEFQIRDEEIAKEILSGNLDDHFRNLEKLIEYEEQNVLDLLQVALHAAPNMLGNDGIKHPKNGGEKKVSSKALQKVLDYYEQILWGEVGNYLEHIILWWGPSPLAARSPHSSQHLREWITQFTPTAQIPAFIISTLTSLADALGVHVTSTSWDKNFRLTLVHSKVFNDSCTGQMFSDMLQDLVHLCNQCEITNDWVVGAPLDELPLVEQIPVLHRLDHSVHTTRLWAACETKKLANDWNVASFFGITHKDIINCLSQLSNIRLADHSVEIEKGGLGVHVEVCAKMREKLVSEVKVNVDKLKQTSKECVECLASVCTTISLANLKMIFPKGNYWSKSCDQMPSMQSPYVYKYMESILTPVILATEDEVITNMILTLVCDAWLHHIYTNKIHFSQGGALQLLADFASIAVWITENQQIKDHVRVKMLKNEVLKRCEGVGRLLLRNPGERIRMQDKFRSSKQFSADDESPSKSETKELMPAEMYVPNQEQWLELRASKKRIGFLMQPLCCSE